MKNTYNRFACIILLISAFMFSYESSFSQWEQTDGPPGLTVTTFFDNGDWLYCGTESKGPYRSSDHGNSWSPSNGNMENSSVFSFTQDASYLYAGTDSGVFRSSDDGLTWEHANNGIEWMFANSLLVANGYLFMGGVGSGVQRSADHGDTWEDASGGALGSSYILAMCYAGGKLIVEADNYIFYSTDDGDSWFLDTGPTQFYIIDRFYTSGDTVMACTGSVYFPSATVFVSYDAINTWHGPITVDPNVSLSGISRVGNTFYVGSANGIFSSIDFGLTWSHIAQTGLRPGHRLQNHFIHSGNNFLLSYEEIGIYSSQTGAVWTRTKNGFPPASAIDNCMINVGTDLWSGTHSDGVYFSPDGGDTWDQSGAANITVDTFPNSIIKSMLYVGNNIILAGGCGEGLYRSDDYGDTWTHITDGFIPGYQDFVCITSLAKSGSVVLATTTDTRMYYSTDDGLTWQESTVPDNNYYFEGMAVHDNVVCIGAIPGGVYRSTNNGISFTLASALVDPIVLEADTSGNFYAGSFDAFYRSTDNGITWNGAGSGLPFQGGAFAIKAIDENVFAGADYGIFYSDDYGATFTNASEGLDAYPNNAVQGFAVGKGHIYAGTFRDAIWKRSLGDFGIATALNEVSPADENDFSIISSSAENIVYQLQLGKGANAQLKLIDVMGRTVQSFSLGNISSGMHHGTLELADVSAGVYFLELTTVDFSKTEKFVVRK